MADSSNANAQLALAIELRKTNHAAAIPHFQKAIELGSHQPDAFWMLAGLLLEQGAPEAAMGVCQRALPTYPENFELLFVHSIASLQLAFYEPAVASCLRQLTLRPRDVHSWTHLGMALRGTGRLRESEDALRQACSLSPTDAAAHFQLALTLLLTGDYKNGFAEYEWRWRLGVTPPRVFQQPLWDAAPLAGKRILLWPEQGAGDFIQFTRYLPLVASQGGTILLETPPELTRLASWLPGSIELVPPGITANFDVHCPLLALASKFTAPIPSLQWPVPEELKRQWAERLGPKFNKRVALVWAGNPNHSEDRLRSIALETFRPLFTLPEVDFFGLQLGAARNQIQRVDFGHKLRDLAPFCKDYAETAAALTQMDLLISVDTSVAHLSAALGLPTWILLQFSPDWRWHLNHTDSVWYPTVRLFRQEKPNDWSKAMEFAREALGRTSTITF